MGERTYGAGHLVTTTLGQTRTSENWDTSDHLRTILIWQKHSFLCVEDICQTDFNKTSLVLSYFFWITTKLATQEHCYIRKLLWHHPSSWIPRPSGTCRWDLYFCELNLWTWSWASRAPIPPSYASNQRHIRCSHFLIVSTITDWSAFRRFSCSVVNV